MEVRKADVINFLFVFCFPIYGIGKYIAQVGNYSAGQLISVSPLILILLFYAVDRLQQKEFEPKISPYYYLLLFFSILCVISFFIAVKNEYPGSNLINSATLSLAILAIVHGAIVVQFYNSTKTSFSISSLLYWGLTIDIIVNLTGYAFGLRNPIHSIEGRLNLPFGQGFYSTANTVALLNILIIGTLIQQRVDFRLKAFMILQFIANLYLIGLFNSRLSILIFLLIVILIITRTIRHQKILYFISLFTLPLLLSFAEIIYTILQLPGLNQLLKRVSYKDITGFNGRGHLWNRGMEWFLTQGEGFFLGNGYHGYYTIGLINDLEKFWFRSAVTMHMHSSTFEYLLSIGIIGVIPFMFLLYKSLNFIKNKMIDNHADGILLPALIYLLFLFQIDNYGYINNFGALIMITIISTFIVKRNPTEI